MFSIRQKAIVNCIFFLRNLWNCVSSCLMYYPLIDKQICLLTNTPLSVFTPSLKLVVRSRPLKKPWPNRFLFTFARVGCDPSKRKRFLVHAPSVQSFMFIWVRPFCQLTLWYHYWNHTDRRIKPALSSVSMKYELNGL